jgi:enoyl-CoA hydratase/carnithine racemase
MAYEDLLLEKDGQIAIITLNLPQKLNALSRKMTRSLVLAIDEIAKDDEIRVVILTGAGRGFCSGADVSAMLDRESVAQASRFERFQVLGWPFYDAFPRLDKPVIAAINGPCVGGGFSLALSCDVRIASEAAVFGAAQVARGLVPDYGMTYYLPMVLGVSRALELMFSGAVPIDAAEALRLGIVSRVVPPGELMKAARELATRFAQQAPIPVALTKRIVWRSLFDGLSRQLDLETAAQQICFQTEDHKESVSAFLEKRPLPKFKGK